MQTCAVRAADVTTNTNDVTRLRKKIGAPFEHQADMLEKWALKTLEEELRLEGLAAAAPAGEQAGDAGAPAFSRSKAVSRPYGHRRDRRGWLAGVPDRQGTPGVPQITQRLDVIEANGEQVVNYPIMSATGFDVLGYVELLVKDGKAKALLDIEVDKQGLHRPMGRDVIEALLAAVDTLDIRQHRPRGPWLLGKRWVFHRRTSKEPTMAHSLGKPMPQPRTPEQRAALLDRQAARESTAARAEGPRRRTGSKAQSQPTQRRQTRRGACSPHHLALAERARGGVVVAGMNDPLVPPDVRADSSVQLS